MSQSRNSLLASPETHLATCPDARVWSRSGSGANIVVMTDDTVSIGLLRRKELKTAKQRIRNGEPLVTVLGDHFTSIPFGTVRKIRADHKGTELVIEHTKVGTHVEISHVRFSDQDTRKAALSQARSSLPGEVEVIETQSSRLLHAFKPFNILVVSVFLGFGSHWYFQSEYSKIPKRIITAAKKPRKKKKPRPRKSFEERMRDGDFSDVKFQPNPPHHMRNQHARNYAVGRGLARNRSASRILILGIAILGTVGFVLGLIGYKITMTALVGIAAASSVWLLARIFAPPRSITLLCKS